MVVEARMFAGWRPGGAPMDQVRAAAERAARSAVERAAAPPASHRPGPGAVEHWHVNDAPGGGHVGHQHHGGETAHSHPSEQFGEWRGLTDGGRLPDGTYNPNPGFDGPAPTGPAPARRPQLRDQVALLYPWLARMPELLDVYAAKWAETGDAQLAWAAVRASPLYDRYFPGNRRPDGSFRYSEQEYAAVKDGYRQLFRDYGMNPDLFEGQFTRGIEGDVSVQEAQERLASRFAYIQQAAPQAREWYAQQFGWRPSDGDLLASSLDPNVTEPLFRQRAQQSLVGGAAAARGFQRDAARVQMLMQSGLSADQAREFYAQAAGQVPSLSAFAARYYDPDDSFGIDDFEAAVVLLDPEQQRRARGLLAAERSAFSQRGAFAGGRGGGLSGLAER